MAEGDTEQAETAAGLSWPVQRHRLPFRPDEAVALDNELFEHCLAVLRLDHRPTVEVHGYFPGGEQRWQQIITRWNLNKCPAPEWRRFMANAIRPAM